MGETSQALIAELRADISGFRRDLERAVQSSQDFGRRTSQALDSIDDSSRRVERSTTSLRAGFSQLRAAIFGLGLGTVAREGFQLATQFTAIERTLTATTGSASAAGEAYQFVRNEALRLGTDIISGSRAFAQMTENVRGSRLEGQGARTIFSALGETIAGLGLSNDQYNRALLATNQILTRGAVQTEELNQLTEAGIPIRRELAQALGITGRELAKSLEQGIVPAEALLLVSERLRDRFGEVADIASSTTPLAFATLTSVTRETTAQFFQAIQRSDELNQLIRNLTSSVQDLAGSIDNTEITRFVDEIIRLGNAIFRFGGTTVDFFTQLRESIQIANVRPFLQSLQESTQAQLQALGLSERAAQATAQLIFGLTEQTSSGIKNLTDQVRNATTVLDELTGFDQEVADLFDELNRPFPDISGELETLAVGFEDFSNRSKAAVQDATTELANQVRRQVQESLNAIGGGQEQRQLETQLNRASNFLFDRLRDQQRIIERAQEEAREEQLERTERHVKTLSQVELEEFIRLNQDKRDIARIAEDELNQDRLESIRRRAEAERQAIEDAQNDQQRIQEEAARQQAELLQEPFRQAARNLQDTFADVISDTLRGDINDIQDVFSRIGDIALETAAQIAAAFAFQELFGGVQGIVGALGQGSGLINRGGVFGAGLGPLGVRGGLTLGQLAAGAGIGIGSGFLASGFLGQLGLGGPARGGLSGALGGAAAGTFLLPGLGTAIGAGVGGLGGFIGSLFGGGGPRASQFAVQTTAAPPSTRPSDDALVRSAFGFVSLIDEQSKRANAQAVANVVAELDRTIAGIVSDRQEQIIARSLQAPVNQTILGQGAADTDEALAEVLAQRLKIVVGALAGGDVSSRVVGNVQDADIGTVQRRVQDALEILRVIEEIEAGPTTQAADSIRAINEEFGALITRAREFGIASAALEEERQRRIAEVAQTVNQDVTQRILEITDPARAAQAALAERQRLEFENARDANANLIELERLHALERQQLADQLAESNEQIRDETGQLVEDVQTAVERAFEVIRTGAVGITPRGEIETVFTEFIQASQRVSPLAAQYRDLTEQFRRLTLAAQELGRDTSDIRGAFQSQRQALLETARNQALDLIASVTDPVQAAQRQVQAQLAEFLQLAREGFIPRELFADLQQAVLANAQIQRAIQAASGGGQTPIEQLNRTFEQFIRAGSPLSQAGQQLRDLSENFLNLVEAAQIAGVSTRELEQSFISQARTIRERVIGDINRQFEAQIQGLQSIDDLLASFQTDATNTSVGRLSAAQNQFREALRGGDAQDVTRAAQLLRDIARQQFGSAEGFFDIERQIEDALIQFRREQEQVAEDNRRQAIEQANRELRQLDLSQGSFDALRQIAVAQNTTSRGIEVLISRLDNQNLEMARLRDLLDRALAVR